MGGEQQGADINVVLGKILEASVGMAATAGELKATVSNLTEQAGQLWEKYDTLHADINGNGGGVQEGMKWKLASVQQVQEGCPGRVADKIVGELKESMDSQFQVMTNLLLVKQGEQKAAANAAANTAAEKDDTLLTIKKSSFTSVSKVLHLAAEHPKTVVFSILAFLSTGAGAVIMNKVAIIKWLYEIVKTWITNGGS